ncbi:hypothetical protein RND81_05G091300 [Saponaria officinalis]|uniref:RING-type E3 ubiquitin transferase n=1 Tax=Saponaria officinalis TaxID=3572 RepID=A0AAW1KX20_SAPOF
MDKNEAKLVVAVALTGSRKGKNILKWALDQFLPEGYVKFIIFHVYPKITFVPTPLGAWVPITEAQDDIANNFRREIEWKKKKALLPYQKTLKSQKVESDIEVLESDDIAKALCSEIAKNSIRHLVVGSSTSSSAFLWKTLSANKTVENNLSANISENAPRYCSVYVVADGKLQNLRPSESKPTVISVHNNTSGSSSSFTDSSSPTLGSLLKSGQVGDAHTRRSLDPQQNNMGAPNSIKETEETRHYTFQGTNTSFGNYSAINQSYSSGDTGSWVSDRTSPGGSFVGSTPAGSSVSIPMGESFTGTPPTGSSVSIPYGGSFTGTPPTGSSVSIPYGGSFTGTPPTGSYVRTSPAASFIGTPPGSFVASAGFSSGTPSHQQSQSQAYELEKLRMELKHVEKMYELARNSNVDEKLNTLSKELEAALTLEEEKAKEMEGAEKNKLKGGQREVLESGKNAEESENRLKQLLANPIAQCQKFNWNEILEATSSLSEEFKIGTGAFGTVFKCKLHHTTAAVKVLHSKDTVTNKQFLQELEILSTIRHPHLLLLLGAVPEESCLVYEYMENGSLDDRLFRKDNCPPLPWYERVRISWEVASALAFLHSTKPKAIIHRDLKPANILLDQHLVSKIGDAGLGTTMNIEPSDKSLRTLYKETSPVGTLCYIDPEYQRTGRVSTKSDVYALGVVILQLLTAKSAVGISYLVEDAVEEGTLEEVLDKEAGKWPEEEALALAKLGLQCSELRGRDRPDLRETVLPSLERLKEAADSAREQAANAPATLPLHFICPIRKVVMDDPYVAADGYTYDREAIQQWLAENNTSPTTSQPLPHKFIMPNYTLLEAIKQWKSKQPSK